MRLSKMNFKGQKLTWANALGHAHADQGGSIRRDFSLFVSGLRLVTKTRLLSLNDYGLSDFHSILIHAK
jgi:hypothetical protein